MKASKAEVVVQKSDVMIFTAMHLVAEQKFSTADKEKVWRKELARRSNMRALDPKEFVEMAGVWLQHYPLDKDQPIFQN